MITGEKIFCFCFSFSPPSSQVPSPFNPPPPHSPSQPSHTGNFCYLFLSLFFIFFFFFVTHSLKPLFLPFNQSFPTLLFFLLNLFDSFLWVLFVLCTFFQEFAKRDLSFRLFFFFSTPPSPLALSLHPRQPHAGHLFIYLFLN